MFITQRLDTDRSTDHTSETLKSHSTIEGAIKAFSDESIENWHYHQGNRIHQEKFTIHQIDGDNEELAPLAESYYYADSDTREHYLNFKVGTTLLAEKTDSTGTRGYLLFLNYSPNA